MNALLYGHRIRCNLYGNEIDSRADPRRRLSAGCIVARSFGAAASAKRDGNSDDPKWASALFGIPHLPRQKVRMKPTNKVESVQRSSRYDVRTPRGYSGPQIDFNYQSRLEPAREMCAPRCGVLPSRGIGALTSEVFGADARRDFIVEAALFALIAAISAWPIASMISAMMRIP